MLEITEGAIKNGQSRETGNIDKEKHNKKHNTTQYMLDTTIRKQAHKRKLDMNPFTKN